MASSSTVKVSRPKRLSEDETLTTFKDWRNNLEFYLQQHGDFKDFLTPEKSWKKTSEGVAHRGLASATEACTLDNFLGVIASLSPPLIHGDIINDCEKLSDIYKLLRSYYSFAPSESTFIKFAYIKRGIVDGKLERPLHLYLRMRQFVRDNLLLSSGRIQHDGKIPDRDEKFSPTTERLIVLRWLEILHPALPNHVGTVYAHDLQTHSLKDLQPRLVNQIEELLQQVETRPSELDAQFARLSTGKGRFQDNRDFGRNNRNFKYDTRDSRDDTRDSRAKQRTEINRGYDVTRKTSQFRRSFSAVKSCDACRSVGEPFIGHEMRNCPNIPQSDRSNVLKNFRCEIDDNELRNDSHSHVQNDEDQESGDDVSIVEIDRVNIVSSPRINVTVNSTPITMILDTGATGSMLSLQICELARLKVYPSSHSATLADGNSKLTVVGEVHTTMVLDGDLRLPFSAVVATRLKAGLIVGMDFLKENAVVIDISNNCLKFPNGKVVTFNNTFGNPKVSLLRIDMNNVILPGETVKLPIPVNFLEDEHIAVEPRGEQWPEPCIVENADGHISLTNTMDQTLKLKKHQVIGQIRSVISENEQPIHSNLVTSAVRKPNNSKSVSCITIDPDKILTPEEQKKFHDLHTKYSKVFSSQLGTYNDKSGVNRASVDLSNNKPLPRKGKVPSYCSSKSKILQEKFDELHALGILRRPEEVGVKVVHSSPSFLVKKPNNDYRLVTSFVELNKFIHPLPSRMSTTKDVLTDLGKWKYIIKSDLKSAYFQIKMEESSQKWLGTNSPFKGMFVYDRAAMGLRNMAEYLEELVSRVLGDCLAEGILTKEADDLYVGAKNSIAELFANWERVLQKLSENNLTLSPDKTVICPKSIKILGWMWNEGQLKVDPHRVNPLTVCPRPTNVKQMRSFVGAFRSLSVCVPRYATYLCPLEDVCAGKESAEKIQWNEELNSHFKSAQKALTTTKIITLPHPDDQLILVSDGCNSPAAVGSTLYVKRGPKLHIAGFFSAKIKKYQLLWLPCEIEALGINLAIHTFSNYIRESKNTTKFFTDSKTCVQAYEKLSKGGFSLSPRISSFLMNLNSLNVSINHIRGSDIPLTDFCSRNAIVCPNNTCQVCDFVKEHIDMSVNSLSVHDIDNGISKMPYYNTLAWKAAQKQDQDLRRTYSQLSSGTRPGKKEKNLKVVRKYLLIASISSNGTLIHRKSNPYGRDFELIVVPQSLAKGLISALHLRLGHPKKTQFKKLWDRYFYTLDAEKLIQECTESCSLCASLKTLPTELFTQSSSELPNAIGIFFSADVIRREKQKILLVMDIFSSFKLGLLISDEQKETLQQALIQLLSNYKHPDGCKVRVDNAPGFVALREDKLLLSLNITLDFGRVKNKNGNPTIDKAVQEVEHEIKCICPEGGMINPGVLATAIGRSNNRIRSNGLSSKEVLTKRDSFTGQPIEFVDDHIQDIKYQQRKQNHAYSEVSKSKGKPAQVNQNFSIGQLVHVKNEGTKHKARERYLITAINHNTSEATLQKLSGNQLRSKKYLVTFQEIYPAVQQVTNQSTYDSDSDDEVHLLKKSVPEDELATVIETVPPLRRSSRLTKKPEYLSTDEIERTEF